MGLTQLTESDTLKIHAESCPILWDFAHLHPPQWKYRIPLSGNIEYPSVEIKG